MADPKLLFAKIPGMVLYRSLLEMKRLSYKTAGYELPTTTKAALIVTHYRTIQIVARFPNLGACAILDIESSGMTAPPNSDGYSVIFDINAWLQALRDPITQEPSSSLLLTKSKKSIHLSCEFEGNVQSITLAITEIVKQPPMNINSLRCSVRVTMRSGEFTKFINALAMTPTRLVRHDTRTSEVQMQITTTSTIRWDTPTSPHDHPAQSFLIEGLKPRAVFRFPMRWHLCLFNMLRCVSLENYSVEVSVLLNTRGEKLNRIRFLRDNANYFFYYLEDEPLPESHRIIGVK